MAVAHQRNGVFQETKLVRHLCKVCVSARTCLTRIELGFQIINRGANSGCVIHRQRIERNLHRLRDRTGHRVGTVQSRYQTLERCNRRADFTQGVEGIHLVGIDGRDQAVNCVDQTFKLAQRVRRACCCALQGADGARNCCPIVGRQRLERGSYCIGNRSGHGVGTVESGHQSLQRCDRGPDFTQGVKRIHLIGIDGGDQPVNKVDHSFEFAQGIRGACCRALEICNGKGNCGRVGRCQSRGLI